MVLSPRGLKMGSETFQKCPVSNCHLTNDHDELGWDSNSILFNTVLNLNVHLYGTDYKGQFKRLVENMENIWDRLVFLIIFWDTNREY